MKHIIKDFASGWRGKLYQMRVFGGHTAATQLMLVQNYRMMKMHQHELPTLKDVGFQHFSQSDEDGILLYIFSMIGHTNKIFVDIGAGSINGSNTANLAVHHGWSGLLIDAIESGLRSLSKFYATCPTTRTYPPKTVPAFVTRDNINSLLSDNNIAGEIDLLSIDIDGVDYWIWEAITAIDPRVVIVEYQSALGPEMSVTVPYKDDFMRDDYEINHSPQNILYAGASLAALVRLANEKGYRLVGCNSTCYNAFFVKKGIGDGVLPEITSQECFFHPRATELYQTYFDELQSMDWVES